MIFAANTKGRKKIAVLMAFCLLVLSASLVHAGVEIVEIENIQIVKSLSATVTDPEGYPLSDAKVEEMSPDWQRTLRSTQTDGKGRFALTPVPGRRIYYLQISDHNFDPLRVRVQIDPRNGKKLRLRLVLAT